MTAQEWRFRAGSPSLKGRKRGEQTVSSQNLCCRHLGIRMPGGSRPDRPGSVAGHGRSEVTDRHGGAPSSVRLPCGRRMPHPGLLTTCVPRANQALWETTVWRRHHRLWRGCSPLPRRRLPNCPVARRPKASGSTDGQYMSGGMSEYAYGADNGYGYGACPRVWYLELEALYMKPSRTDDLLLSDAVRSAEWITTWPIAEQSGRSSTAPTAGSSPPWGLLSGTIIKKPSAPGSTRTYFPKA